MRLQQRVSNAKPRSLSSRLQLDILTHLALTADFHMHLTFLVMYPASFSWCTLFRQGASRWEAHDRGYTSATRSRYYHATTCSTVDLLFCTFFEIAFFLSLSLFGSCLFCRFYPLDWVITRRTSLSLAIFVSIFICSRSGIEPS